MPWLKRQTRPPHAANFLLKAALVRGGQGTQQLPRALIACFSGQVIPSSLPLAASPAHGHAEIQEPFVRVPGATQVIEEGCLVRHTVCVPASVIRA